MHRSISQSLGKSSEKKVCEEKMSDTDDDEARRRGKLGKEADLKRSWPVRNEQANFEKGVAKFRNASKAEGACVNTPGCSSSSPSQQKFPKTNKKETPIELGNQLSADSGRASSEILEWLQEFREHVVDEVRERGDSHASSSHELSLEPTFKRREDLSKHSVYTHFTKDRNCEICQRTKIIQPRAEDATAEAYFVQKILVT